MAVIAPDPNMFLCEALQGKVPQVYLSGDAKEKPQYILGAVSDGAEIARLL